jgi:cellulose synthase (UDP-forming)
VLAVVTLILGLQYIIWRYAATLNRAALWFAIPVVVAESYSLISTALFVLNLWRPTRRVSPPPIEGATVDVFITTYNESIDLVRRTAEAATQIRWPSDSSSPLLNVYVLDDGGRPEMAAVTQELGCGYISRGDEWVGKPRHAKAGNVNNALLETSGEYVLILDCDQIPDPRFVERTIGYFRDELVAFVQTPQRFYNIPPGDPFGADASLFYGPVQQGKDGWNAAFFCGSNAILRREALMQLGLIDYAIEMEQRVTRRLRQLERGVARAQRRARGDPQVKAALERLEADLAEAHQALEEGAPLERVSDRIRQAVSQAQQAVQEAAVQADLDAIARDLRELSGDALDEGTGAQAARIAQDLGDPSVHIAEQVAEQVAAEAPASPQEVGVPEEAIEDLALTREDEAIPVLGLPTFSITEDMAVAMRLHARGWRSVFHCEVLAHGLAPEDLCATLQQRLRWAQGTIQIAVRENPLWMKGLTLPQRLQYFTTIYSYFSGFFTLIYLLAPILYLATGIAPVSTFSGEFLWRLVPYLVLNKLIFLHAAHGIPTLRGEQYSVSLFPLWIQAVVSVLAGRKPRFAVTPKERQSGNYLRLVWPQTAIACGTVVAVVWGVAVLALGWPRSAEATLFSVFWGVYNLLMLWAILRAAVYRPPPNWQAEPPVFDLS